MCVEFPSLSWLASTSEKALKGICSVVKDCISDLSKSKEELPLPFSSRKCSGKFMVRVPPKVHRYLAIKAAEAGVSLNRNASAKLAVMILAVIRSEKRKMFSKEKESKFQRCIEIMA